jgi:CBS domain-containing protein
MERQARAPASGRRRSALRGTAACQRHRRRGPFAPVHRVRKLLSNAQISVVVVCDPEGAPLGIITETILVRRLGMGQADFFTTGAGEVMKQGYVACAPEDVLSDVLAMMHARELIHVLLIGADGKLIGVVNARDGLRALLAAGNHEEALLRDYVMGIGYQ